MTNTTKAVEVVMKRDELGRIRTPVERRQSLLEEFERSGLSGIKFAALAGVKYSTFASWLHKRRLQTKTPADATHPMRWLEAVIEQGQSPADKDRAVVRLQLPGGARLEISHVRQVGLAAALEKPESAC